MYKEGVLIHEHCGSIQESSFIAKVVENSDIVILRAEFEDCKISNVLVRYIDIEYSNNVDSMVTSGGIQLGANSNIFKQLEVFADEYVKKIRSKKKP